VNNMGVNEMKFKLELNLNQVCLLQAALEDRVENMQKHVDTCKELQMGHVVKAWEKRRDDASELLALCNTTHARCD